MPCIIIQNLFNKTIQVGDTARPLLYHLQQQRIDWMQDCGGKGRCTTCKVSVIEGMDNFEEPTMPKKKYAGLNLLRPGERLACQARIHGDITVAVPQECKLPHIVYSE